MPGEPAPAALPRHFLRACVLLLLREQPAHGYDLLERLTAFGYDRSDPGAIYRALRALEEDGFVRSAWESSENGPDRRIYELTRPGMESLHEQAKALSATGQVIGGFLSRYQEFVALDSPGRTGARR
jgi:poly-beta-hydroxybutyrate-responsive repressor